VVAFLGFNLGKKGCVAWDGTAMRKKKFFLRKENHARKFFPKE